MPAPVDGDAMPLVRPVVAAFAMVCGVRNHHYSPDSRFFLRPEALRTSLPQVQTVKLPAAVAASL